MAPSNPYNPWLTPTVFLKPTKPEPNYATTLDELRTRIMNQRTGYIDVQLRLPFVETQVHLQLRCTDVYIIGFRGKDGVWYHFKGEKEKGGWGDTDCGVKGNYNNLEIPDTISVSDVKDLRDLAEFKKNGVNPDGSPIVLKGKLIVIAAAVVSEALRFTEVETNFTKLFDGKINSVELKELKDRLFVYWDQLSQTGAPGLRMKTL